MKTNLLWKRLCTNRTPSRPFFLFAGVNVLETQPQPQPPSQAQSQSDSWLRCTSTWRAAERLAAFSVAYPEVPVVFKGSFDKANRTSLSGFRGPGLDVGLKVLEAVGKEFGLHTMTDVHECWQVEQVAEVVDIIQIPSFLCRQTDLLLAAGRTDRIVHIKKGQFATPEVMTHAVAKVQQGSGNPKVIVCERGSTFSPSDLVFDPRNLLRLRSCGVPVVMDCTHACQFPPGPANPAQSSGDLEMVEAVARAAVAIGVDGVFLEFHPDPRAAPVDGRLQLSFEQFSSLMEELLDIARATRYYNGNTS